jgi:CSLREA domain-containing protein
MTARMVLLHFPGIRATFVLAALASLAFLTANPPLTSAGGAVFTASIFDDLPVDGCTPGHCSLREAISAANASPGLDTVRLRTGTYRIELFGSDDNNAAGDFDIRDSVIIDGEGPESTIVDAKFLDRAFDVGPGAPAITVTIKDLKIRNGLSFGGQNGGAVFNGATLLLDNVHIENSESQTFGGAVHNAGTLSINNSIFSGNTADFGGAISSSSNVTMNLSTVVDNEAGQTGGGIRHDLGRFDITNSTVAANTAGTSGGGIYNSGFMVIDLSAIESNVAGTGGGIHNIGGLEIIESTIRSNVAPSHGGGIRQSGHMNIKASTINHNHAGANGGGGVFNDPLRTMTALNTTFSNNRSDDHGGGIYNNAGVVGLLHVTIAENVADADDNGVGDGGGLHSVFLAIGAERSLIGDNTDRGGEAPDCSSDLEFVGPNFLEDVAGCNIIGSTQGSHLGFDPRLTNLAFRGGPTQTHGLLATSLAVDIESAECPPPFVDQRGFSRPADGDNNGVYTCDFGAFELDGQPPTATPSPTPSPTASPTPSATPTSSPTPTEAPTGPPAIPLRWGDINCSGVVEVTDPLQILRFIASLSIAQQQPCPLIDQPASISSDLPIHIWGDVDCNSAVDTVDSLALLRHIAALPVQQIQPCPPIGSQVAWEPAS